MPTLERSTTATAFTGLWLPLITPFRDGAVDTTSLTRLVQHFAKEPIDGLVLAATTGEGMTLDDAEIGQVVSIVAAELAGRLPIVLGLSGCDTRKLCAQLSRTRAWPIDGYLIACPYYVRPSQEGLLQHFTALAGATAKPVLVYNIPYRTGVNMTTETLLRLAALDNIVGVKDCCMDANQSFDLIRERPDGFSVLTGEDALFHSALAQGADGGILATAHAETGAFARMRQSYVAGDTDEALAQWQALADLPRLLFEEPSPAPIKHWLWRAGLIDSPEVRLPMTAISADLTTRLDRELNRRRNAAA